MGLPAKSFARQPGAGTVEYSFIAVLVLIGTISAIMLIGGNLNSVLQGLKSDVSLSVSAAESAESQAKVLIDGNGIGGVIPPPGPDEVQICNQRGWCVNIPAQESYILTTTAGGMGGEKTRELANVIMQIARQLVEDPEADPTLTRLVTDLANNGHLLADREDVAHDLCPIGQSCLRGDGLHEEMRIRLGHLHAQKQATSQAQHELMTYLEKHPQSLPIEMQNIIRHEAHQINQIANAFPNPHLVDGNMTGDVNLVGDYFNWELTKSVEITHDKSNTICGQGGSGQCFRR